MSDEVEILTLADLPEWDSQDIRECGTPENWSYGRGGHGLPDNQWHINYVEEIGDNCDFKTTIYLIPTQVNPLIKWHENWAREKIQKSMRQLLGL